MNGPSLLILPAPTGIHFPHTYHPDGRPKTTEDAAGLHTYLYAGPNGALSGETITGSGLLAGAVMNYGYDDQKRRDQHTWTWGSGRAKCEARVRVRRCGTGILSARWRGCHEQLGCHGKVQYPGLCHELRGATLLWC